MKKLQYNSPVILTFFLLSLGVLLLDWITGGWTTLHAFCVYRSSLADPLFYVRLFGHVLGHADFDHFLGNMLLLLVIGPPLEEKYGSRTLLAGILLTAGVSGILQCVFFPGSALLGASGIVFMLIMLASLAGMKDGRIPLTLILAAVLYLGQEVYAMVALRTTWPTSCIWWAASPARYSAWCWQKGGEEKEAAFWMPASFFGLLPSHDHLAEDVHGDHGERQAEWRQPTRRREGHSAEHIADPAEYRTGSGQR